MQRPPSRLDRVPWAVLVLLVAAVLVLVAVARAGAIPRRAHDDFGALIRADEGSMSHSATYPGTCRHMAAQSSMLQRAFLGLTGVALVTVGAVGVVGATTRERQGG